MISHDRWQHRIFRAPTAIPGMSAGASRRVTGPPGLLYLPAMLHCTQARPALALLALLAAAACSPTYSPDDYATRAVQQTNRVDQGVIVGQRRVMVTAEGTTGAAAGAAAGGIVGAQTPGGNMASAIGGVGGALIGGLLGTATERVAGDTTAVEYIVRKENGDLLSVVQRDRVPLQVGERVLVIGGAQARIVPDYTRPVPGAGTTPATAGAGTPPAGQAAAAGATPLPGAQAAAGQLTGAATQAAAGALPPAATTPPAGATVPPQPVAAEPLDTPGAPGTAARPAEPIL